MMREFYVGYMPKAPKNLADWIRLVALSILVIGLVTALVLVSSFQESRNSTFEYGIYKEITGRIYKEPVPTIRVTSGNSSKTFALVNFGKSGVSGIIERFEQANGGDISDYEITVRGSLIYYDGVTLLELSHQDKSIVDFRKSQVQAIRNQVEIGELEISGELVDSKCFFGVMKPGFGKIHRSCAIRCISGCVPVALSTPDHRYFFIRGEELSPYFDLIGKPIKLTAVAYQLDDLNYLNISGIELSSVVPKQDQFSLLIANRSESIDSELVKCN